MDVHAAASNDPAGPVLVMVVTDVSEVVPGKPAADETKQYDELVQYGARVLRNAGATLASTEHIRMLGLDGLQVTGTDGRFRISIRLIHRGARHFEFRCFDLDQNAEWRCASALTSFQVADLPDGAAQPEARSGSPP